MTSLPVVQLTLNFLKICVIKFDSKSGCIKAKLCFRLGFVFVFARFCFRFINFSPSVQIGLNDHCSFALVTKCLADIPTFVRSASHGHDKKKDNIEH